MSGVVGQITNGSIIIEPSNELIDFIRGIKNGSSLKELPVGIASIIRNKNNENVKDQMPREPKYLTTEDDRKFLKKLNLKLQSSSSTEGLDNNNSFFNTPKSTEFVDETIKNKLPKKYFLTLQDLHWLYNYLHNNDNNKTQVYLHELLEKSRIILPQNPIIPRNPELQKRCDKLKASQQNKEYNHMTKNVDNVRRRHPEDTISYQMKQINRQMIVIAQFIFSVLAGFAFGFIGVELIVGNLDFGFRLLLGIICALVIALAELYFLAKKLNEDLQFEEGVYEQNCSSAKTTKLD